MENVSPNTDQLGPYEALPIAWPSYSSQPSQATCPVCSALTLDELHRGEKKGCLEYIISIESSMRLAIKRWSEHCDLCRLVRDIDNACAESDSEIRIPMNRYHSACGRKAWQPANRCYLATDLYNNLGGSFERVVVQADPVSDSSLSRIKDWIRMCDEEHGECGQGFAPLPNRVIEVKELQAIRLLVTDGQVGQYAALSHCWGASESSFVTKAATLADMRMGFKLDQAPQTIRDAILITHSLGIPYLWIDSLCIIQDSTSDWRTESSNMGDVYSRAYLTIAAANAAGDAVGFLKQREFLYSPLRITAVTRKSFKVFLQTERDFRKQLMYFMASEPLHDRGWTLQERYLSPRILEFGMLMTTFECRAGVFEESLPGRGVGRLRRDADELIPCVKDGGVGRRHWADMISEYSDRRLTYDSDKLPALSGVASRVSYRTNNTYCAGIWWEDLPFGLLWKRRKRHQLRKPSK